MDNENMKENERGLTIILKAHEYEFLKKLAEKNQRSMAAELRFNTIREYKKVFGDDSNV